MAIKDFYDLTAWKESHKLVLFVYNLTKSFPKEEIFGLTNQMRRSAVSISSNIAEGFGRRTYKDKAHFYYQSRGSISELKSQLMISRDLSYINAEQFIEIESLLSSAHKLLQGLITKTNSFI